MQDKDLIIRILQYNLRDKYSSANAAAMGVIDTLIRMGIKPASESAVKRIYNFQPGGRHTVTDETIKKVAKALDIPLPEDENQEMDMREMRLLQCYRSLVSEIDKKELVRIAEYKVQDQSERWEEYKVFANKSESEKSRGLE